MPESVETLKLSMMGKAIAEIKEFNGLPVDRLRELAEADRAGRLVVLPPKDYTWTIRGDLMLGIIAANCRAAEKALEAMKDA